MGGFLGIGGSSAKTDRKTELTGFGDLSNIFNFGMDTAKGALKTGQGTTATGLSGMTDALGFFKKLMSGDRNVAAEAIAPETNQALAASDAARNQIATTGTGRSGGIAGANQTVEDKVNATIDNLLFGARAAGAGEVSSIGKDIAGVGLAETNQALGFGNLAESAASDLTKLSGESRKTSYAINQDTVAKVTSAIENVIAGLGFA